MSFSILVIDDDPTIRATLVEFFEALGHQARGAATATEGRQALAAHAPDVALVATSCSPAGTVSETPAFAPPGPPLRTARLTTPTSPTRSAGSTADAVTDRSAAHGPAVPATCGHASWVSSP